MSLLKDKVIVVTGAGSGMGRSYAIECAKQGAMLALNDFNAETLGETVAFLPDGTSLMHRVYDVSDKAAADAFARDVVSQFGRVDVVINNAGISDKASVPAWEVDTADFERVMNVNFYGVVHGTNAFLPYLLKQDAGTIINVSSVFGMIGMPNTSAYCASKFAVRGFSESLMVELFGKNIEVLLVHPGGIATNIADGVEGSEKFSKHFLTTDPDDIARYVLSKIGTGSRRVVYGNQASKVHFVSRFYSLRYRCKLLYQQMMRHENKNA